MIQQSLQQAVLTITMSRLEKKNALIPAMYLEMANAINGARKQGARVIIIKGEGEIFTAGNDVSEFVKSVEQGAGEVNETYQFMHALLHCDLPVIAQVEGLAIGIGSTMLLHCDFVLSHENTQFSMPFINLGLVPEYASSYIIPRVAGHLRAAELLMLGERFDAKTAKECGFVSHIYAHDLENNVIELANKLAAKPAVALAQTKALLKTNSQAIKHHIDTELKIFVEAMQSPPAREAFSAFIEKRAINIDVFK